MTPRRWASIAALVVVVALGGLIIAAGPEDPRAHQARLLADAEGEITRELGCGTVTVAEVRADAIARAEGGPVDGWLLEAPDDGHIYLCEFEGSFPGAFAAPPPPSGSPGATGPSTRAIARVMLPEAIPGAPPSIITFTAIADGAASRLPTPGPSSLLAS